MSFSVTNECIDLIKLVRWAFKSTTSEEKTFIFHEVEWRGIDDHTDFIIKIRFNNYSVSGLNAFQCNKSLLAVCWNFWKNFSPFAPHRTSDISHVKVVHALYRRLIPPGFWRKNFSWSLTCVFSSSPFTSLSQCVSLYLLYASFVWMNSTSMPENSHAAFFDVWFCRKLDVPNPGPPHRGCTRSSALYRLSYRAPLQSGLDSNCFLVRRSWIRSLLWPPHFLLVSHGLLALSPGSST